MLAKLTYAVVMLVHSSCNWNALHNTVLKMEYVLA